jgi:hypothetical protein
MRGRFRRAAGCGIALSESQAAVKAAAGAIRAAARIGAECFFSARLAEVHVARGDHCSGQCLDVQAPTTLLELPHG